jgi:subtilisin family serine protease
MKKITFKKAVMFAVAFFATCGLAKAQGVEVSAGGDIVSSYIWRGQYLGGVSVQPGASLSVAGLSLTAWGSVGFDNSDIKEFDFTLGYGIGGFSAAITDYWFRYPDAINDYFDYGDETAHMLEVTLGYDFGPAAISWNTYFAGADYAKANGDRAYSTYIEGSVPFKLGGLDLKAELGLSPWESIYSEKFNIVNIGLTAGKEIRVTESFAIPAFTKIIFNPHWKECFFVFGVSL